MPMDQAPQGAQGGGAISELADKVGGALKTVAQAVMQSKQAPPEAKQMAQQIVQMFDQLVQMVMGGGEQESPEEGQAQGQPAPMEAAGNKGAMPAM